MWKEFAIKKQNYNWKIIWNGHLLICLLISFVVILYNSTIHIIFDDFVGQTFYQELPLLIYGNLQAENLAITISGR
jgi:uncharacterized membrane protein